METFSLQNFIKICSLETGLQIQEIRKKLDQSSGYDFYNSFQRAVKCFANTSDQDEIDNILESPAKSAERKHNQEAYRIFLKRFGKISSIEALDESGFISFPEHGVQIRVDPLFSIETKGQRQVFSFWAAKKPRLSQRYAAVACLLMREGLGQGPLANSQFRFFDLVENRVYSEKLIKDATKQILQHDVRKVSNLIRDN